MSTPPQNKKRIKHRPQTYARKFDELKVLHKFSFRKRKNFTPQQKSAITRLHRQHRQTLKNLREGRGVFKKTTTSQIRGLKRGHIEREGFTVTNKGVYVPGVRSDKVKAKRQRVTIKGKGKKTRIRIQLPSRIEEFYPYEDIGETFMDFVKRLIKTKKPDDLYIQNESGRGKDRYTPRVFMQYIDRDIMPRIETFKRKHGIDRNPFVGVWLIWYKFR